MVCHAPNTAPAANRSLLHVLARFGLLFGLLLGLLFGTVACSPQKAPDAAQIAPADTYFPISLDGHPLQLQLALNPAEQAKGLMHRDALGEDQGMLFLFEEPEPRSFWMRNTKIPLDIGYFDASGRLREVHPLFPFDETAVPSNSPDVLIAVETNQGWFRKNGVRAGAQLDMAALWQAVEARGASHPLQRD
jgi:uncharacterized membrane protein (UPF0127 family)